jgi:hypothetical protein
MPGPGQKVDFSKILAQGRKPQPAPAKPEVKEMKPEPEEVAKESVSFFSRMREKLPEKKKLRNWAIGLAVFATLSISGLKTWDWYTTKKEKEAKALKLKKAKQEREKRIQEIVVRMNACKNEKRLMQLCLPQKKIQLLKKSARGFAHSGDYVTAGIIYAQLGETDHANRMIRHCEAKNDKAGAKKIRDELRIMSEAIKRYINVR